MKKLLLLVLCSAILSSCSNNNDDTDVILGTWSLFSISGEEVSDCEKMSTLTFNSDGTATGTVYMIVNGICTQQGVSEITTWVNNGNMTYVIGPGTNNSLEWNISFSNNNNTLTITNEGVVYKRE